MCKMCVDVYVQRDQLDDVGVKVQMQRGGVGLGLA